MKKLFLDNIGGILMHLLGVDIGGTKCAVTIGKYKGDISGEMVILDKISINTEVSQGFNYTMNRIIEAIYKITKTNKLEKADIGGIGVSCGGPLDSKRGIIMSPPNLLGWDNVPITEMFEKEFKVKARLQNDANACALAEWKYGAAKNCRNVIFLTFGTGMGAGLILDGKLYSGTNDMAGEIGHISLESHGPVGYGKAGSMEGFCSGGGLAQLGRMMVLEKLQMGEKVEFCKNIDELGDLNAKTIAAAAGAGDVLAREIYSVSGQYLGKGLSILIDLLNPEMIVIGSIFARSIDLLLPYAKKVIERESLRISRENCKVVPAKLGDKLGDYAALAVAQYGVYDGGCGYEGRDS